MLSRTGQLRLLGLLTAYGEAPTELRQELRVPAGTVDFLLGHGGDLALLAHDPGAVPIPETVAMPPQVDATLVRTLGMALSAGDVDLLGVWGPLRAGRHEVVCALAQAAGMPLRQVVNADIEGALNEAAALDSVLWLRTDDLDLAAAVAGLLTRSRTPVCLSGTQPWRPPAVLAVRAYAEIAIARPSYHHRRTMWARALPELDANTVRNLGARYLLSDEELRAVASLARSNALSEAVRAQGDSRTQVGILNGSLAQAVAAITSSSAAGGACAITPRRRPEDLVLPPSEYQMLLELAGACREWPRIAEDWGFAAQQRHRRCQGSIHRRTRYWEEPGR